MKQESYQLDKCLAVLDPDFVFCLYGPKFVHEIGTAV